MRILSVFPLLVTSVFIYWVFKDIELQRVLKELLNIRIIDFCIIMLCFISSYALRSFRLKKIIETLTSIRFKDAFVASSICAVGNSLLPARAGDILRIAYLTKKTSISWKIYTGTTLLERLIDTLFISLALNIALLNNNSAPFWLSSAARFVLLIVLLMTVVALNRNTIVRIINLFNLNHILRISLINWMYFKVKDFQTQLFYGLGVLSTKRGILIVISITVFVWITDFFCIYYSAESVGINLNFLDTVIIVGTVALASVIPTTPGGIIGVYQLTVVNIMVMLGYDELKSISSMLIYQLAAYTVMAILGIYFLRHIKKLKEDLP